MKAAIYTRVSTDSQAEVEFNSCETQEIKIRSFVSSQNDMKVVKVYSDQGYSGSSLERPGLSEMLHDIEQGMVDLVISYKIDRLTRSPKDFYQLIEIFEKHNVSFLSITERFDTSTPSGRLLRNIMLTFAQFERELISERIRDKMYERSKKGMWNGGHPPFGYKKVEKKLVVVPEEVEIIRKIFESFVETKSLNAVYKQLKEQNLFNRAGIPLAKTAISCILDNIVYIGRVKHKYKTFKGIHDPIISRELFEEVKKIREDRTRPKKIQGYNNSLFPGIVQCKECGSTMCSTFTNKLKGDQRTRYFYYQCSIIDKRDRSFCGIRQVSASRLDKFVIENLDKIRQNKQYIDSLLFMLNHNDQARHTGFEPGEGQGQMTAERVQEILKTIVEATKLKGKTEKRLILKRHIEKVIYSKETIEVIILYSDSVDAASGPLRAPSAELKFSPPHKDAAIFRQPSSPQNRRPALGVRLNGKMERGGFEPPKT